MTSGVVKGLFTVCVLVSLAVSLSACSQAGPSSTFEVSSERLSSTDATIQAQAALEVFFNELPSGDSARTNALIVSGRGPSDWNVSRLVVESITPTDFDPSFYGSEGATGRKPPEYRAFSAPVRIWPGDGSVTAGERLDWIWLLERGIDGRWRVRDWGYY